MKRNPFAPTDFGADSLEVRVSELLVATSDQTDAELDAAIGEVLRLLRERLQMDVVFVSEFVNGRRVFRQVAQAPGVGVIAEGESAWLEESWCQRVVDGRLRQYIADAKRDPAASPLLKDLPFPIGTHISTPLVLSSGEVYGTLCCFSFEPNGRSSPEDLSRLKLTARLAAQRLDNRRTVRSAPGQVPDWSLKPK
jgi:GAF domain-containing protein